MHQVQPRSHEWLSAANLITASRFLLAGAVAVCALVDGSRVALGTLLVLALLTDLLDGRVARARGTAGPLGARLDQEADALLILVLSAVAAAQIGAWVLVIGLARYAFGAVFAVVPGLRSPPSQPRYWCKIVAAGVGVVLAVVVTVPLPAQLATALVSVVAVLLAESFLHEAIDRWRAPAPALRVPGSTYLAFAVVWISLLLPGVRDRLGAEVLLRLPLEAVALAALALLPWRRVRAVFALLAGILLAVLVVATALDAGFWAVFHRTFDPVGDWSYLGPGVDVLGDSIGPGWARVMAAALALLAVLVVVALPLATLRLVRVAAADRRRTLAVATALGLVWAVMAAAGTPLASVDAVSLARSEVNRIRLGVADHQVFAQEIASDDYRGKDPASLLASLAGKDVLLVFVESYGRVAVQDTTYSRGISAVLDQGTADLAAAGYRSRSAFLTSPTFGAGSWLAHASLQSGLWVDSQRRYRQLLGADRITLTSLFGEAGWRTVFDVPADTRDWPEGKEYYGFQAYLDSRNVDYAGPEFGYTPVPDQYTLEHFRRTELAPGPRRPVMAEIDLISSHHPWTPLPEFVPWHEVGDGTIYDAMSQEPTATQVFDDSDEVKRRYGLSVEYTWRTLISFLTTHPDPGLVMIVVGDHQPHGYVSGEDPGHDVPISVISADPAVLRRIDGWQWQPGLRPAPDAPVWRMDAFRDRFLAAF